MKKTYKDYFKIALTILIIAGLFMPYTYGVLPFDIIFENYMNIETLFGITIPILATIPFLLLLIFKHVLKDSVVHILKIIFLILFILVLADYGYGFYDSLDNSVFQEDKLPYISSIVLSLLLILLTFKSNIPNTKWLETVLLTIISFPILLYFTYGITNDIEDLNYGSYVLSISFILLYIMAVYDLIKNRSAKKQTKPA